MVNRNLIKLAKRMLNKVNHKLNMMDGSDEILNQQENDCMMFTESVYLIDEATLYDKRNY